MRGGCICFLTEIPSLRHTYRGTGRMIYYTYAFIQVDNLYIYIYIYGSACTYKQATRSLSKHLVFAKGSTLTGLATEA